MSGRQEASHASEGGEGRSPDHDLADIWGVLDALPRTTASADMAATTVDMAAVTVKKKIARPGIFTAGGAASSWRTMLWPAVTVVASLVTGVVVGRSTVLDPDTRVLEYLPLVRHLALLEEAGSVKFLQSLAARRNQQPLRMPPDMLRDEEQEFDAAVADIEKDHVWGREATPLLADRRMAVAMMESDEREAIERSAAVFQGLTKSRQRELVSVAAALADPKREELRAAARLWHLIIAASDPPDRKNIVELDAESRLEWLERRSRFRDWMGERRGLPPAIEGGPLPRGPGGAGVPGDGRPRWQGPRGDGGGPQGPRGDGRPRGEPRGGEPRVAEPRPERPPLQRDPEGESPEPPRGVPRAG